jgi:hypothetical protein
LESGGAGFAIDKDFGHVVKTRKTGKNLSKPDFLAVSQPKVWGKPA